MRVRKRRRCRENERKKKEEVGKEKISHARFAFGILQTPLCLLVLYSAHSIPAYKEGETRLKEVKVLPRVTQLLRDRTKAQTRPPTPVELILYSHK